MDNNSYFWSNCPIACSRVVCNCWGDLMLIPLIRAAIVSTAFSREASNQRCSIITNLQLMSRQCAVLQQFFSRVKIHFYSSETYGKKCTLHTRYLSCHLNREGEIVATNDTWGLYRADWSPITPEIPSWWPGPTSGVSDTGGTWVSSGVRGDN